MEITRSTRRALRLVVHDVKRRHPDDHTFLSWIGQNGGRHCVAFPSVIEAYDFADVLQNPLELDCEDRRGERLGPA